MGKGARLKKKRKASQDSLGSFSEVLTRNFQQEIRDSEMWDEMVAEFGEEKATELLQGITADIKYSDDMP